MAHERTTVAEGPALSKCPTGIHGLDEITRGGLPRGRPTLICGSAGCGKTVLAMEFLVRGAVQYGEPGVFMSFEETSEELTQNVCSMGFDLKKLVARKLMVMSHVRVERHEIAETGEYDLEGLFVRLGHAIDSVKAQRVVLDTIESLFSGLSNTAILRSELRRLFHWLKDKGVTAIITGERGDATLTRQGLEEYVSDCVIMLDHRVTDQMSTRRMRIVKYRGSTHGTNEYPFLIDPRGVDVLPITSLGLAQRVSNQRVSTGVPALDEMLGGGVYRGSSVLVSGTAGTGKTTLAAAFVDAACRRGERCAYLSFEESPAQTVRNMRSVGIDLEPWMRKGTLICHAARPTLQGLEGHMAAIFRLILDLKPQHVVLDPVSSFLSTNEVQDVRALLTRLLDRMKADQITCISTSLTGGSPTGEASDLSISSLIDTWMLLRDIESSGERNRGLYVLKSRGMAHSNQIREFILTNHGVELRDAYLGAAGMLTGSARLAQEARDTAEDVAQRQDVATKQRELRRERVLKEARIAAIVAESETREERLRREAGEAVSIQEVRPQDRRRMAASRRVATAGQQARGRRRGAR